MNHERITNFFGYKTIFSSHVTTQGGAYLGDIVPWIERFEPS